MRTPCFGVPLRIAGKSPALPSSRCWLVRSIGWISIVCGSRWRIGRCAREIDRSANLARQRTSDRALPKLTRERDGVRRMVEQPPVVTHVSDDEKDRIIDGLEAYLATLPQHWRRVLSSYVFVDVAHKVVGVGSVGLRAFVVLLQGNGSEDMLFLQLKQIQTLVCGTLRPWRHRMACASGTACCRVSTDAADGQRSAPRLDDGGQARLLRPPVSGYEGCGHC